MNEDVDTVSPTLGFIIKTIEYEGLVRYEIHVKEPSFADYRRSYRLNICTGIFHRPWAKHV